MELGHALVTLHNALSPVTVTAGGQQRTRANRVWMCWLCRYEEAARLRDEYRKMMASMSVDNNRRV